MGSVLIKNLPEIKEAFENGKSTIDMVGKIYASGISAYHNFDCEPRKFRETHRHLELAIVNGCKHKLSLSDQYFDSGKWFEHPTPSVIKPGHASILYVANRKGSFLCGVTVAVVYKIADINLHLYFFL